MTYAIRTDAWTGIHAHLAHESRLKRARHDARENGRHIYSPAHMDATIATLETGDAFDRWTARMLDEQRVRAEFLAHEYSDDAEGPGIMVYLIGAVVIETGLLLGIPAVCWAWQTLGGVL